MTHLLHIVSVFLFGDGDVLVHYREEGRCSHESKAGHHTGEEVDLRLESMMV